MSSHDEKKIDRFLDEIENLRTSMCDKWLSLQDDVEKQTEVDEIEAEVTRYENLVEKSVKDLEKFRDQLSNKTPTDHQNASTTESNVRNQNQSSGRMLH